MRKKILIWIGVILFIAIFIAGIWWFFYLQKAHSTFENYYAFRRCVQLLEKTDDYGICKTQLGEIIKVVKYQEKWFLDGDLSFP